ncbi:MAG: hypothetical protein SFZ03_01050 [Candidatus Melainabacteria bacterium]|nr:hypothetical protein [Candidatus Melainabacteria bacterium]
MFIAAVSQPNRTHLPPHFQIAGSVAAPKAPPSPTLQATSAPLRFQSGMVVFEAEKFMSEPIVVPGIFTKGFDWFLQALFRLADQLAEKTRPQTALPAKSTLQHAWTGIGVEKPYPSGDSAHHRLSYKA